MEKLYSVCQLIYMKNIWIIANWKSYKTLEEALDWVGQVGPNLPRKENLKVVVCPQSSELEEVKKAVMVGGFPIAVGSQDLSPFPEGAYTGEESAKALHQFVDLAILGHSERRKNFGETDQLIAEKTQQALSQNIIPLVCVQGKDTPVPDRCKLIAYEPIFAIGTDQPDTPADAQEVAQTFKQKYGTDLEVLYGGSVSSENAAAFVKQENISGLLIGHKALDAEEFIRMVNACAEI